MNFFLSILIGVFTSLISSIFLIFYADRIKSNSNKVVNWWALRNKKSENKYYEQIASNYSYPAEYASGQITILLVITLLVALIFNFYEVSQVHQETISRIQVDGHYKKDLYLLNIDKIRNEFDYNKNISIWRNWWFFKWLFILTIPLLVILGLYFYIQYLSWLKVRHSNNWFNNKMKLIETLGESDKAMPLRKRWLTMRTKIEYESIIKDSLTLTNRLMEEYD